MKRRVHRRLLNRHNWKNRLRGVRVAERIWHWYRGNAIVMVEERGTLERFRFIDIPPN